MKRAELVEIGNAHQIGDTDVLQRRCDCYVNIIIHVCFDKTRVVQALLQCH